MGCRLVYLSYFLGQYKKIRITTMIIKAKRPAKLTPSTRHLPAISRPFTLRYSPHQDCFVCIFNTTMVF